jgi:hypothetical protein
VLDVEYTLEHGFDRIWEPGFECTRDMELSALGSSEKSRHPNSPSRPGKALPGTGL